IIIFKIARLEDVKIIIYNILGQEIKTVISEQLPAGMYEVRWNGTDNFGNKVSSGIYIYRMETDNGSVKTRKMVFLK
ncbi:MAG: T9SS type A sorting domain-containing protein, partial [Patescibacteria group bacterium]|nr:T9SS type A sorting domain-containing protein [Patescibacteria group bacterium]